jgi:serine O-acetyltransferase
MSRNPARGGSRDASQGAPGTSRRLSTRSAPEPASELLETTIQTLSACADDALSKAVCEGIVAPGDAIDWLLRAERVVLYQRDRSELRAEVPALAERLAALLRRIPLPAGLDPEGTAATAVSRLPRVRELLAEDVESALEGDPAAKSFSEIVLSYPSIQALVVYRIAHELHALGVPLLPRVMTEYAHGRTGIDIHPGARIGRRFFIDHGTGVVIGETCEIGDGVRLYQGVTLGALSPRHGEALRGKKRHPTIEDEVTIYAGATVLGGETVIGRGSVIGGNVWLVESVPPGSRVVAEPARQMVRQRDLDGPSPLQLHWDI